MILICAQRMYSNSYPFPLLLPQETTNVWLPELDNGYLEIDLLTQLERQYEKKLIEIQTTVAPTPVGVLERHNGEEYDDDEEEDDDEQTEADEEPEDDDEDEDDDDEYDEEIDLDDELGSRNSDTIY